MNTLRTPKNDYDALRASLKGPMILPGDADYDLVRTVWTRTYDRKPAVIVRAQGTADVAHAVRFAGEHNLPVSVRSGGHHVSGMGVCDDGMMVDMSLMRSVMVNPKAKTAVVQGGATAIDVIRETQLFGLALPTGNLGGVGVAALALGGGMGYMRRKHGLTCDHLQAADLVLADGTVIHVDEEHHPDLFWAIRGGGGNYGIATTLYFRLVSAGPMVAGIHVSYAVEDAPKVLAGCREFLRHIGHWVSFNIDIMALPPIPGMPPEIVGKTVINLSGMHASPDLDEALQAIEPLRHLAEPLLDTSGPISYTALHTMLDQMLPPEHRGHVESLYMGTFSDALIQDVADIMAQAEPGRILMIWPLGGKMAERSANETAFGDRGAEVVATMEAVWQSSEGASAGIEWVKASRTKLLKHAYNGGTYLNLTDTTENPDVLKNAYGENYGRLRQLKRDYDPHNRFRFNANILPLD